MRGRKQRRLISLLLSMVLLWSVLPLNPKIGVLAGEGYRFTDFKVKLSNPDIQGNPYDLIEDKEVNALKLLPGMEFSITLLDEDDISYEINSACFVNNSVFSYEECMEYYDDDNNCTYSYIYKVNAVDPGFYTIEYNDPVKGISSSLQITVLGEDASIFEIVYGNIKYDEFYELEDTDGQTDKNIIPYFEGSTLQLWTRVNYLIDDIRILDINHVESSDWTSSNPEVASVDSDTGLLTIQGIGDCVISCTVAGKSVRGKLFIKSDGVYVTKYSETSRMTVGKAFYPEWSVSIIGDGLISSNWFDFENYMILEDDTIRKLEEKNLLGYNDYFQGFTPEPGEHHTIWAIKNTHSEAPLTLNSNELAGMTLTGYIVVPTNECNHEMFPDYSSGSHQAKFENCDCYMHPEKLNTLNITYADGTTGMDSKMSFKLEILADTAENNMSIIEEIEEDIASRKSLSTTQIVYLSSLLYQLKNGYSEFDNRKEVKEFPLPNYSSEDLKRIEAVMKKTIASNITLDIPEGVQVSNLSMCADVSGSYVPNQTISLTKDETDTSESTQEIITDGQEVIVSYDINLYKQVDGEEKEQITETVVPLEITIDTGDSLEDGTYKLIREHTDVDTGDTTVETIPCEIDGTNVSFSSNAFSEYTLVKEKAGISDSNKGDNKGEDNKPLGNDNSNTSDSTKTVKGVKTGDTANVLSFFILIILSASVCVSIIYRKKRL